MNFPKSDNTLDKAFFKMRSDGFTLLELVVVIAVLAILSSIVVGAFQQITERAAETVAKVALKQSFMECSMSIAKRDTIPSYTELDGINNNRFFQVWMTHTFDENLNNGVAPEPLWGRCFGPLGDANILMVEKTLGTRNIGGKLGINLVTGELSESDGLTWAHQR